MNFFVQRTDVGDCPIPPGAARADHRGVSNWELHIVARPGEHAANETLTEQGPRRQVWIQRLGAYTKVILVAGEAEAAQPVSTQRWA
jgi:hypothetical protein